MDRGPSRPGLPQASLSPGVQIWGQKPEEAGDHSDEVFAHRAPTRRLKVGFLRSCVPRRIFCEAITHTHTPLPSPVPRLGFVVMTLSEAVSRHETPGVGHSGVISEAGAQLPKGRRSSREPLLAVASAVTG